MRARVAALGLSALALALGASIVPAPPAAALTQEGFRVSESERTSTRDYNPILGQNTAGADAPDFGPSGCGTGGALSGSCDAIPLEIVRPAAYDDYTPWGVKVTLAWESQQLTDDSVQEAHSNDLDMFFYFKTGEQLSTDGATGANPEEAIFASPPSDTYYVIVNNFAGANTGYTVTVEFIPEEILPQVTEDDFARPRTPKPPPPRRATTTSTTAATASDDEDDDDGAELTPVVVGDDDDFSGVAIGSDDEAASIFETGDPLAEREEEEAPPASGVALVLWLIAVPVIIVAVAWWFLRRRAPTNVVPG